MMLNELLLRYSSSLEGVMLSYSDIELLEQYGRIRNEYPHIHIRFNAKVLIFRTSVGQILHGIVNKLSMNHVGMLIHGLFNASITKEHLPEGSKWNEALETWSLPSEKTIAMGSSVAFTVKKFEYEEEVGLISIAGSLCESQMPKAAAEGENCHAGGQKQRSSKKAKAARKPKSAKRKPKSAKRKRMAEGQAGAALQSSPANNSSSGQNGNTKKRTKKAGKKKKKYKRPRDNGKKSAGKKT